MKRNDILTIIEAALAAGRTQYAREAALQLLAVWPGDLSGQMALAQAHVSAREPMPAIDLLETIVAIDPEHSRAQRALGALFNGAGRLDHAAAAYAAAHAVDGRGIPPGLRLPPWAEPAHEAMLALRRGDWAMARTQAERALASAPDTPLPSLLYLLAVRGPGGGPGDIDRVRPLAEGFHVRWPGCVVFSLTLAECLLSPRREAGTGSTLSRAITLLHEVSVLDPAGEVVARYWGTAHPYGSLWPHTLNPDLPGPLPEEVSRMLGLNRLPPPIARGLSPVASHRPSEAIDDTRRDILADIQAELDRLAARLHHSKIAHGPNHQLPITNHQYPTHLLLTSKTRLICKYGTDAAASLGVQLIELAGARARSHGSAAHVLYVDDRDSLRPYGLRPANPENAWEIKLQLRDLALALDKQGQRLTSVLIVGGDDVIPFHRLPNPVDDADDDVPSDNPYATADENFLVPEWSLGRLPAPVGNDPAPFFRLLHATIAAHRALPSGQRPVVSGQRLGVVTRLRRWLSSTFARLQGFPARRKNFGYAARAWHQASAAVFATIGDLHHLSTCPPLDVSRLPPEGLAPSPLSYFNLHGLEDSPEWYGQREAGDPHSPQYPIALRPRDVANGGRAPGVVLTEACYGANILNKAVDDALCLKFLDSGSHGVVGSTKIAYGSIGSPLIGADLLGRRFWETLKEGQPQGEALRQAKLAYAREMHQWQGFLDGEDQKTLISFVLYGDPLLPAPASPGARRKAEGAGRKAQNLARFNENELTLCADEAAADDLGFSRPETVAHIKHLVAKHLPGMAECDLRISQQHRFPARAALRGFAPPRRASAKTLGPETGNLVFTLSKTIRMDAGSKRALAQFVRVTVNKQGKVLKMAISR